jgi:hypothetical protein
MIDLRTVLAIVCSVENLEIAANKANSNRPVIDLLGPLNVGMIASITGETSSELEESTV